MRAALLGLVLVGCVTPPPAPPIPTFRPELVVIPPPAAPALVSLPLQIVPIRPPAPPVAMTPDDLIGGYVIGRGALTVRDVCVFEIGGALVTLNPRGEACVLLHDVERRHRGRSMRLRVVPE